MSRFVTHYQQKFRYPRFLLPMLFAVSLICLSASQVKAQGGWEAWNIRLKDGQTLFASPLVSADEKTVIYTIGSQYRHHDSIAGAFQIEREKIDYIASNRKNVLPKKLPEGRAVEDVIVLRNGKKISGKITQIRSQSLWETILVIDGKIFDLNKIAVIKFAACRK